MSAGLGVCDFVFGPRSLVRSVIWGRQLSFCEPQFCLLRNGKPSAWLWAAAPASLPGHMMGVRWAGLSLETGGDTVQVLLLFLTPTAPFLQRQPRATCCPDNSGPDVGNICLLRWPFPEREERKGQGRIRFWKCGKRFHFLPLLPRPSGNPLRGRGPFSLISCFKSPPRAWQVRS